ncbi:MAG: single-stranded DNA-binding protein [Cyanobacteria bacterium REEB459]|nr:single-stranded DNA-binding protein [Cyanobacteria bacterium REEB459]
MNNCLLLAEIVQPPQLRYTSDNQTPVAEFTVQFPGLKEGDSPAKIKVVGWGNLGQEVQAQYQVGQRVLLEGRLTMSVIDRPEGFKEKQVEMTLQRIYNAGSFNTMAMDTPPAASAPPTPPAASSPPRASSPKPAQVAAPDLGNGPNYDDIPF